MQSKLCAIVVYNVDLVHIYTGEFDLDLKESVSESIIRIRAADVIREYILCRL